jgi:MFS family permease
MRDPCELEDGGATITRSAVGAGIVALAVAMGIGRFAFTPLLPLMIRDDVINAPAGAEWAAANYLGYLLGALTVGRINRSMKRYLSFALWGVALSTMAVAFIHTSVSGAALRFVAGFFSAWVLVLASSLCLNTVAREGMGQRGAWIYTGVGIGITVAGVLAWLGGEQSAWLLWLELGALAAIGTVQVVRTVAHTSEGSMRRGPGGSESVRGHADLIICYGAFGFGYIVPATFLPALAHAQVQNPLVFGLTWPIFGIAAALSVAIVARLLPEVPRRRVWAVAQGLMALGTALPVFTQRLEALTLSALFVGGTFMVTTMAGLQLARELAPSNPTPLLARMTAAFAAGQIAGPVLVRFFPVQPAQPWGGLVFASTLAALSLAGTAIWLWCTQRHRAR